MSRRFYAQTRVKTYTKGLHPVNLVALAFNGLMIVRHGAQSQLTCDDLAQATSIFSAQGSEILMPALLIGGVVGVGRLVRRVRWREQSLA